MNGDKRMNLIDENNRGNMMTQGTATAVMSSYFHDAYIAMLPFFAVAIPLIILDLKYGRQKAKLSGEDVTFNKSIRMTIDKTFSYICWIMLSTTLSLTFEQPFVKYVIMLVIYGLEGWSVFGKHLFIRFGIKVSDIQMLRILGKMLWQKITGIEEDFNEVFKETREEQ